MAIVNLILMIVFGAAALTLAILMAIFVLPEKKRNGLSGFFCMLHDLFNFKLNIVELLIKVLTIAGCIYTAVFGFIYTFTGFVDVELVPGMSGLIELMGMSDPSEFPMAMTRVEWQGYNGLIMMIAGPIACYITGSLLIKFLHMADNLIELNKKTARTAKAEPAPAAAPAPASKKPVAPQPDVIYKVEPLQATAQTRFCGRCGVPLNENGKCPNCDR